MWFPPCTMALTTGPDRRSEPVRAYGAAPRDPVGPVAVREPADRPGPVRRGQPTIGDTAMQPPADSMPSPFASLITLPL